MLGVEFEEKTSVSRTSFSPVKKKEIKQLRSRSASSQDSDDSRKRRVAESIMGLSKLTPNNKVSSLGKKIRKKNYGNRRKKQRRSS